ncbi:PilZ domain-containing protein [Sphingosinicella sp.]|uniref:PilZ domain-containing protein n=1 Tax=Sphingosinicella sp. TaxID=1917971 RepID=UPI004037C4E2
MGVEPFETVEAGKRASRRARVLLAAKLHTPAGISDARLRDLSRHGALIESPAIVNAGMKVTFERGASRVPATVAWATGPRIGIEFDHPIDESELLIHIGRAQPAPSGPSSYIRPGIMRGMSTQDRRLAQAWSVAVGLNLPEKDG